MAVAARLECKDTLLMHVLYSTLRPVDAVWKKVMMLAWPKEISVQIA